MRRGGDGGVGGAWRRCLVWDGVWVLREVEVGEVRGEKAGSTIVVALDVCWACYGDRKEVRLDEAREVGGKEREVLFCSQRIQQIIFSFLQMKMERTSGGPPSPIKKSKFPRALA